MNVYVEYLDDRDDHFVVEAAQPNEAGTLLMLGFTDGTGTIIPFHRIRTVVCSEDDR